MDLKIEKRELAGKKAARRLRHEGFIPGVIYGDMKEPVLVSVGEKELMAACYSSSFFSHIIDVTIGSTTEKILPRDISFDTVTDCPIHVDFQRISKNAKVRVSIAVEFANEEKSPGMKKGGVINFVVHQLECLCSPESIPEKLVLDLSGKEIGDSFTLDQIQLPNGVSAAHPERDHTIATLVSSRVSGSESSTGETESAEAS